MGCCAINFGGKGHEESHCFCHIVVYLVLVACSVEPETIKVTRVVTEISEVEVSRLVEVELPIDVTRIVEQQVEVPVGVEVTRFVEKLVTTTPRPTPQAKATPSRILEETQADIGGTMITALETNIFSIDRINLVRWATGRLEIELFTAYVSKSNQAEVSWEIITFLADIFSGLEPGQRFNMTGSEEFTFALATYSEDDGDRYQSETDFDTFVQINNRAMSYNEWVAAANAGFR